jgi:hypothetical protein
MPTRFRPCSITGYAYVFKVWQAGFGEIKRTIAITHFCFETVFAKLLVFETEKLKIQIVPKAVK